MPRRPYLELLLPAVPENIFLGADFNWNASIQRCLCSWGGSLKVPQATVRGVHAIYPGTCNER